MLRKLAYFVMIALVASVPAIAQDTDQQFTFVRDGDVFIWHSTSGLESVILEDLTSNNYTFFAWSPDGSQLAFKRPGDQGDALVIFDTRLGTRLSIAVARDGKLGNHLYNGRWSPDGRWIAYNFSSWDPIQEQEMYEYCVVAVTREALPRCIDEMSVSGFEWLPQNLLLLRVHATDRMEYYRFDPTTGGNIPLELPYAGRPTWSPDGSSIAMHKRAILRDETATLNVYDTNTGAEQFAQTFRQLLAFQYSPDSQWISYTWDNRWWGEPLWVANLETGRNFWVAGQDFGWIGPWVWSPDSRMILYTLPHDDPDIEQLHIVNIATLEDRLITDYVRYSVMGWSPDSQWVHYRDHDGVIVYNIAHESAWLLTDVDRIIGWRPG